jgi:hypothetical protein
VYAQNAEEQEVKKYKLKLKGLNEIKGIYNMERTKEKQRIEIKKENAKK